MTLLTVTVRAKRNAKEIIIIGLRVLTCENNVSQAVPKPWAMETHVTLIICNQMKQQEVICCNYDDDAFSEDSENGYCRNQVQR